MKSVPTRLVAGTGGRLFLYLRKALTSDDRFPFKAEDDLTVEIVGKTLVVRRA